jgi:YjbE family integral membrane protein
MTWLDLPDWLGKPLAVLLIDLSLAGDNAVAIALLCANLPRRDRRRVLLIGAFGAVLLRVLLAGLVGLVLAVPGLKLTGGALLALVALNLAARDPRRVAAPAPLDDGSGIWAAAALVTLIDVLLSLDNVVAIAAVAGGSLPYLAGGLMLSVSILMFGSALVVDLLRRYPDLARLGAALLGWVAGQMAVTDPVYSDALAAQAPALPLLVPALVAAFIYLSGPAAPARPQPVAARPAPRAKAARPPAGRPPSVAEPLPARHEEALPEESGGPERFVLVMFVGLFVIVGLALGALSVFAGGLIR